MPKADAAQGTADQMGPSRPTEGSKLNPKMDVPEYGKKVKNYAEPSSGTTGEHTDKNDALGNPGRFKRNGSTTATADSEEELDELRMKQLDTCPSDPILGNRYQGN